MKKLPVQKKRHFLSREKQRKSFSFLVVFLLLLITLSPSMVFAENIDLNEDINEIEITNEIETISENIVTDDSEDFVNNLDSIEINIEKPEDIQPLTKASFDSRAINDKTPIFPYITYYQIDRTIEGKPYGEPLQILAGNSIGELNDPETEYWPDNALSFLGWFCSDCDNQVTIRTIINENRTIYAKFNIKEIEYFSVTFWDSIETKIPVQENFGIPSGSLLPAFENSESIIPPQGMTFLGDWRIYVDGVPEEDLTKIRSWDYSSYTVNANLILVPEFFEVVVAPPDPSENIPDGPELPNDGTVPPLDPPETDPPGTEPPETDFPNTGSPAPETEIPETPKNPDTPRSIGNTTTETPPSRNAGNTGTNSNYGLSVTEEAEVAGLLEDITKTITPSRTPLYPNHEVSVSPIFPPLTAGDSVAGFNFALTGATIALMLLSLATYFTRGKQNLGTVKKHGALRLISIFPSIAAIILLVPTQDLSMPLRMADSFTLHHAIILLIQLLLVIFARKSYSYDNYDDLA